MAWATEAEVLALTGTSVLAADLAEAHGVIEVMSGVTQNAENLTARNLRLLRYAVSYQTVWQAAQVDILTRTDVAELDQDGVRVTPSDRNALLLAPLAARCLSQLSWRRPSAIQVNRANPAPRFASLDAAQSAFLTDRLVGGWNEL